jgi:hypothetical protein
MAPEIIRREAPTAACDQYSLASILYFALTGQPAFKEQEEQALLRAILQGDCPSLHRVRTGLPDGLVNAIYKAMHVDPGLRFASVADFSIALLPFASPKGNSHWTQYFSNVVRPVDRKLFEPVSAIAKAEDLAPVVNRIRQNEKQQPSPPPPILAQASGRKLNPVPLPNAEVLTLGQESRSYSKHLVGTFAMGTVFGAALAVLITIALLYGKNLCPSSTQGIQSSSQSSK